MPDGQFKDISLSDYKGKYVVFFFYPLDSTFVCPMESIAFSDRAEEFKKLNCQVIGASADSHFCHLAWINTPKKQGGLRPVNIPVISDPKRTIAQDYGVLKANEGISFRDLFIIDDKRYPSTDYHKWPSCWPFCGWDTETSSGLLVYWQTWGSMPSWLEAWQWYHQARCPEEQRIFL